jgi:hypothetical protein
MDPHGHITVNEHAPSQRFHRFVEEKVRDWMREREITDQNTEYEVAFFDEDSLGETSCLIVVQQGENLWRAWETADNPRLALSRSLENLHIDSDDDDGLVCATPSTH